MGIFYTVALIIVVLWAVSKLLNIGRREASLPPGPPTIPLLGNALMIPSKFVHFKFTEWAQQYGDIFSLKIARSTIVVLSSPTAVKELLDKRSAETSGRPPLYTAAVITDGNHVSVANSTTDVWRIGRKALQTLLSPQAVISHMPVARAESTQLLFDLLTSPGHFLQHIDRYTYSIMSAVAFGKRCPRYDNPEASTFFEAIRLLSKVVTAEAPPVDVIPILKYVPERWANWKVICQRVKKLQGQLYFDLLRETKQRLAQGQSNGCFMEEVLQRQEELGIWDGAAAHLGGVVLEGGSESSASLLSSVVLCFVAFPETLRKAQQEIDLILPDGRPPCPDDIPSLPYIRAIVKEIHRFRPMGPLGLPHALLESQEYRRFVIPKDTVVFINVWGMMHDPNFFDEPEVFRPERFLQSEHGTKPSVDDQDWRASLPFGSGRRLCPGMLLANTNMTLSVALLVWAFDFTHALDSENRPIAVDIDAYNEGLFSNPRPFRCKISSRSKEKEEIIRQQFIDATATFVKYEEFLSSDEKQILANERAKL